jgi:hypothetical protein
MSNAHLKGRKGSLLKIIDGGVCGNLLFSALVAGFKLDCFKTKNKTNKQTKKSTHRFPEMY